VYNKLNDFIYTQRQHVPPQRLSLSTELHLFSWRGTACPSETSLTFYQITQRYILAGSNSHSHGRENLKCRTVFKIFSKMSLNSCEIIRACVFYIYFAAWMSSFDMKMIKRVFEEVSCLHVIEYVLCWKLENALSLNQERTHSCKVRKEAHRMYLTTNISTHWCCDRPKLPPTAWQTDFAQTQCSWILDRRESRDRLKGGSCDHLRVRESIESRAPVVTRRRVRMSQEEK
jgi:hypothetical protein